MKTNIFKRIVTSVIIAVIIIAGMPVLAFSADAPTIDTNTPVSLTLTKYKALEGDSTALDDNVTGKQQTVTGRETMKDVEFTVLKFATLVQENDGSQVKLQYSLTEDGARILSESEITYTTNQKVSFDTLKTFIADKTARDFASTNLKNIESSVTATTGDNGVVIFTSNSSVSETTALKHINGQGLYLVVETAAPDNVTERAHPFFVSLPMSDRDTTNPNHWQYDVYAYPKNTTGNIDFNKQIYEINGSKSTGSNSIADGNHSASANIGDVITYRIPFTMAIPAVGLTKLEITDTMCEGLTLKTASTNVASTDITINRLADSGSRSKLSESNYTVKTTGNDNGTTTLQIIFTTDYIKTLNSDSADRFPQFEIMYKAVLNEKAVIGDKGNDNNAKVVYRSTNDTTDQKTTEVKTKVYTWGINLLKVGEKDEELSGVKFKLAAGSGTALKFEEKDGVYVPSAEGTEELVTGSNGKITINGLKNAVYKLTEIKAKSGYVLLKNPVEIVISGDNKTGSATATVNGKEATMSSVTAGDSTSRTALVEVKIVNSTGFLLPSTGGAGTTMFTIAGIAIIVISGTLLIILKRKSPK